MKRLTPVADDHVPAAVCSGNGVIGRRRTCCVGIGLNGMLAGVSDCVV